MRIAILKKVPELLITILMIIILSSCGASDTQGGDTPVETEEPTVNTAEIKGHYEYYDDYSLKELDIVDKGDLRVLFMEYGENYLLGKIDESKRSITLTDEENGLVKYTYEMVNDKLVITDTDDKSTLTYTKTNSQNPIINTMKELKGQTYYNVVNDEDFQETIDISDDERILMSNSEGSNYFGKVKSDGRISWDDGDESRLIVFNDKIACTEDDRYAAVYSKSENYYKKYREYIGLD